MDIFYNQKGIGDVLIIPIQDLNRYDVTYNQYGDIIRITDSSGNIAGYNIFHASFYFDLPYEGQFAMTEQMLNQLKNLFNQRNINDSLDFDLSPKFVVGYVKDISPHENSDHLQVCQVDLGDSSEQIVCGAPNVDKGQHVVVAKTGAVMPNGMKIKPTKLRGVPSNGMICSKEELGLSNVSGEKGIYVLDDTYQAGDEFDLA